LFIRLLRDCFKPRLQLLADVVVLRHQLNVLQQSPSSELQETGGRKARHFSRTLVAALKAMPLDALKERMRCPKCGGRK
jgi:hypothetical protein